MGVRVVGVCVVVVVRWIVDGVCMVRRRGVCVSYVGVGCVICL